MWVNDCSSKLVVCVYTIRKKSHFCLFGSFCKCAWIHRQLSAVTLCPSLHFTTATRAKYVVHILNKLVVHFSVWWVLFLNMHYYLIVNAKEDFQMLPWKCFKHTHRYTHLDSHQLRDTHRVLSDLRCNFMSLNKFCSVWIWCLVWPISNGFYPRMCTPL